MKRIPVDECPAGPWLDAAVAEAQGKIACDRWSPVNFPEPGYIKVCWHDNCYPANYPAQYSRNIAAVWELVDEMYEEEDQEIFSRFMKEWMRAGLGPAHLTVLRITRAYLKAKGIKFVEVPEELCDD